MIDFILLFFLIVCTITAVRMKDLLNVIILLGAYSLIMAVVWTRLNAVDVALTEAAVGAGITTFLLISALSRTKREEVSRVRVSLPALIIVLITGALLIYGTIDMPVFGDSNAPSNTHVVPRYIEKSYKETGVPNFVTAILTSYRGYDTLGEVTVIFTAGVSVLLLLRRKRTK